MSAIRSRSSSPTRREQARDAAERIAVDVPAAAGGRRCGRRRSPPARRCCGTRRRAICPTASSAATGRRSRRPSPRRRTSSRSSSSTTGSSSRRSSRAPRSAATMPPPDAFDLLLTGQGVHSIRNQLADAVFHMPPERIAVHAPDVGGGFGVKNFLYPEWVLVLWAARRLGRPVNWVAERGEEFRQLRAGPRQPYARPARARSGRAVSRARCRYGRQSRRLSLDQRSRQLDQFAGQRDGRGLRHPGRLHERARRLYQHRADRRLSRRRQARGQLPDRAARRPRRAAARHRPDRIAPAQSDPPLSLSQRSRRDDRLRPFRRQSRRYGAAHRDRGFRRAAREQAAARGRLRGLGIACFLETSRGTPGERAEIRFEPDGRVALVLGTQSNGQGHETSYPQIAADLLGLADRRLPLRPGRYARGRRAATGMAAPARCTWAARRCTRRRRWSSPRAARSPPTCCRPTRTR